MNLIVSTMNGRTLGGYWYCTVGTVTRSSTVTAMQGLRLRRSSADESPEYVSSNEDIKDVEYQQL